MAKKTIPAEHPYNSKLFEEDYLAYKILHDTLEAQGKALKKGDKVKMTMWGVYSDISPKHRTGVVAGFTRCRNYIKITRRGIKTVYTYWPGFWTKK